MDYEIYGARFEPGGGHNGNEGSVWTTLTMAFTSKDNDNGKPSFDLSIPLERNRNQTFGEQEEIALDHARAILTKALHLLEQHSLSDLAELGLATRRAESHEEILKAQSENS